MHDADLACYRLLDFRNENLLDHLEDARLARAPIAVDADCESALAVGRQQFNNGFGYRRFHSGVLSPYLWSYSNHYTSGKYVADGTFDPDAVSKQCGSAVILRRMAETGLTRLPVVGAA